MLMLNVLLLAKLNFASSPFKTDSFYHKVTHVKDLCIGANNISTSYAGHIGLESDSERSPKRSFFWYFEAENDASNAPIILSFGGGPGSGGLANPLFGQGPCSASPNGLVPSPHRWTQHHNLIALDHPIGVGFSYGSHVNSSRTAAYDVYDFLQKFFVLFPNLAGNKFVVSSGSYGGVYVPHVATVIHEQNMLVARGRGRPGAIPIHLDALILSNPFTNPSTHFRWLLQYRCMDHHVFNSTDCTRLYAELPTCLDSIDLAYERPTVENRRTAFIVCGSTLSNADTHGTVFEDIRRQCTPDSDDPVACHPEFGWVTNVLDDPATKAALGLPLDLHYQAINREVNAEFVAAGDMIQQHHLLYPPLLAAGIRVLHYVGAQDAVCAWPGVFSFLKLLPTPFQSAFVSAPDVPWPEEGVATCRNVGSGAGNMTYILLQGAGHFVLKDQPALAKAIVERWVANEPFLTKGGVHVDHAL
ncbi:alpha/beta-hydrolase [Mycena belliarum]|uniref:carboxypeptidase C n=1 Tax=Mycena belliarum TaxID=1033014 RepID=A0AAD6U712_9AGAR|nr:alpha/beta-hydrolase [Mycena belliae]